MRTVELPGIVQHHPWVTALAVLLLVIVVGALWAFMVFLRTVGQRDAD